MIEEKYIGETFPALTVDVEIWQLKFFAKAVGETNPIYFDEQRAREAGHRSIVAPPTYAVTLSCAVPNPFARLTQLGMDLTKILHTNQRFEYFAPIYGRDCITFVATIVDVYEKRNGKFQFMVEETVATNQMGELTTRFRQTIVERR
tara:strand:- start:11467 stop:11907 length:441 start_codon:yes stop_codon:yes gene_type:complete